MITEPLKVYDHDESSYRAKQVHNQSESQVDAGVVPNGTNLCLADVTVDIREHFGLDHNAVKIPHMKYIYLCVDGFNIALAFNFSQEPFKQFADVAYEELTVDHLQMAIDYWISNATAQSTGRARTYAWGLDIVYNRPASGVNVHTGYMGANSGQDFWPGEQESGRMYQFRARKISDYTYSLTTSVASYILAGHHNMVDDGTGPHWAEDGRNLPDVNRIINSLPGIATDKSVSLPISTVYHRPVGVGGESVDPINGQDALTELASVKKLLNDTRVSQTSLENHMVNLNHALEDVLTKG